jgi:hypothetical protein
MTSSNAAYYRDYFAKNKAAHDVAKNKYYDANVAKVLVARAKKRASKLGLEFDLSAEALVVPECCPVFGTKLIMNHGGGSGGKANSFSLDRIDSGKGYTHDNVVVVSWRANHVKNNASMAELAAVVDFYTKRGAS